MVMDCTENELHMSAESLVLTLFEIMEIYIFFNASFQKIAFI